MHSTEPFVVYLFHFDQPVQAKQHYIGSVEAVYLNKRLRAHREGYGARLTSRAWQMGVQIRLVALWFCSSRDFEKVLKVRGHASKLCPTCTTRLPDSSVANESAAGPSRPRGAPIKFIEY